MAGEGDPARAPDADISWSCLGSATHTAPAHTSKCPLTTTVNHSNSRFPLHSLNGTADALRLSDTEDVCLTRLEILTAVLVAYGTATHLP